jgi:hypothetical protein
MARLGGFMLVMGIGSLVLPTIGLQFRLMSLFDQAQPVAGIAFAAGGGLFLFLGARQNPDQKKLD